MAIKPEVSEEKEVYVSPHFPEYVRPKIEDPGLDETIKRITPEKIEKAYQAVFGKETARIKAIVETCIHCGLCAEACQWYLSNDRDPTYAPVAKVKMTVWELMKRKGKVEPSLIYDIARIVFTECNICHRCSLYCPFGLDITFIIGLVRRFCVLLGVVPQRMFEMNQAFMATLNQVWMSQSDYIDTLFWREEEGMYELKNLRIPMDVEGVEVIWYPLAAEPKAGVYHIDRIAKIFQVAGVNWTMLTINDSWDSSNMPMFIRDFFTMQRIVRGLYDNAARLRVKRMVLTE